MLSIAKIRIVAVINQENTQLLNANFFFTKSERIDSNKFQKIFLYLHLHDLVPPSYSPLNSTCNFLKRFSELADSNPLD